MVRNSQIESNKVVLTRTYIRKLCRSMDALGSTMREDELMEISFLNNSIVIDTDGATMILKLENQE